MDAWFLIPLGLQWRFCALRGVDSVGVQVHLVELEARVVGWRLVCDSWGSWSKFGLRHLQQDELETRYATSKRLFL